MGDGEPVRGFGGPDVRAGPAGRGAAAQPASPKATTRQPTISPRIAPTPVDDYLSDARRGRGVGCAFGSRPLDRGRSFLAIAGGRPQHTRRSPSLGSNLPGVTCAPS